MALLIFELGARVILMRWWDYLKTLQSQQRRKALRSKKEKNGCRLSNPCFIRKELSNYRFPLSNPFCTSNPCFIHMDLSNYRFPLSNYCFFTYKIIDLSIIEPAYLRKLSIHQYRSMKLIYGTNDYRFKKKLSSAHLCNLYRDGLGCVYCPRILSIGMSFWEDLLHVEFKS